MSNITAHGTTLWGGIKCIKVYLPNNLWFYQLFVIYKVIFNKNNRKKTLDFVQPTWRQNIARESETDNK